MAPPASDTPRSLEECLGQIDRSRAIKNALLNPPGNLPDLFAIPLRDALALFSRLNIDYALVGGTAAMFYGYHCATVDINFILSANHQNVFAANPAAMHAHHFDRSSTWKLYHDSGIEIDLWKDDHSDEIAARAKTIQFADLSVRIADPHDLVAMKLRAHRLQDDYDISEILKHTPIDESLLQSRITPDQFAHFQSIKARITP